MKNGSLPSCEIDSSGVPTPAWIANSFAWVSTSVGRFVKCQYCGQCRAVLGFRHERGSLCCRVCNQSRRQPA
jgi:hypothetical protein